MGAPSPEPATSGVSCWSPTHEEVEVPAWKHEAALSTRGRVLRILVIGPSNCKQAAVESLRTAFRRKSGERKSMHDTTVRARAAETECALADELRPAGRRALADVVNDVVQEQHMLIFNVVPSRDLDSVRRDTQQQQQQQQQENWLEYVPLASAAVVVVDARRPQDEWLALALRWTRRVADVKQIPVALMVDNAENALERRREASPAHTVIVASPRHRASERARDSGGSSEESDESDDDDDDDGAPGVEATNNTQHQVHDDRRGSASGLDHLRQEVVSQFVLRSLQAFRRDSSLQPCVGCFLRSPSNASLDDSAACITQLVRVIEHNLAVQTIPVRRRQDTCAQACTDTIPDTCALS